MAENEALEVDDRGGQKVPQIITDEFFDALRPKVLTTIRILREKEDNQLANEITRIFAVAENLQSSLKDEQVKLQQLEHDQVNATGRINEAVKISQKDQDTIRSLRNEILEAWKVHDRSQCREIEAIEKLHKLQVKFDEAQVQLARSKEQSEDKESGKQKEATREEVVRLVGEVEDLNKRLQIQRAYTVETQKKLQELQAEKQDIFRQWDEATNDSLSNKKKVANLEAALETMSEELEETTESMKHYQDQSKVRHARLIQRDEQLVKAREEVERLRSEKSALTTQSENMTNALAKCKDNLKNLQIDNDQMKQFMRMKEDENRKILLEQERQFKKADQLTRKISRLENEATKDATKIMNLQKEIFTAEKERDSMKKASDNMKRDKDALQKKVENLLDDIKKRDNALSTAKTENSLLEESKKLVDSELKLSGDREKKSIQTIRNIHTKLEMIESEKLYIAESLKESNDFLKLRNKEIQEMKTLLDDLKTQLAHSMHVHNSTVKELKEVRQEFQKCQDREFDIKDRMYKCHHQIEDMTSKLVAKFAETVELLKKVKRLEKKNRELKRDIGRCQENLNLTHEELKSVRLENKTCKEILRQNDSRFVKMKGEMDKLLRERNLIANQMIRRTDENELREKESEALKTAIERGEASYNDRLKDIKLMTNEVLSLRSQCNVLKRGLENTTDLRHEVLQLHRKLQQERSRAKLFEKEMLTPMNVHHWRKTHRFDAKRMELTRKCQLLQKKVLRNSAIVAKSEEVIEALKAKLNVLELEKNQKPSIELQKKLMFSRSKLESNTKRMKAAIAISQANVGDLQLKENEIAKLQNDLSQAKMEYIYEKREREKLARKLRDMNKQPESETMMKEKIKLLGAGDTFMATKSPQITKIQVEFPINKM